MVKEVDIALLPGEHENPVVIRRKALQAAGWKEMDSYQIVKRSIDARRKVVYRLRLKLYRQEVPPAPPVYLERLKDVSHRPEVVIIGAGPAGYFAALELIELGMRPVIFERGLSVKARRRSLRDIQQHSLVDPDSNYCFGEGGAGTYSDGKLYTRAHKRGKIEKVLRLLVEHGAPEEILIDAHPHIGSNKLPRIITALRETIRKHGGEVHFRSKMTDLLIEQDAIRGVVINGEEVYRCERVILATGHSARDVYELLYRKGVRIEAKPFALGVRVEHPQPLIDRIQYHRPERGEHLPAASYSLACQIDNRGVFSFCMCPGGLIVPAVTAPGEIVVNGMSLSRRDSPFANSGFVTEIRLEDLGEDVTENPLAAMIFQRELEQKMFRAGDGSLKAPAQRLTDFAERRLSPDLPPTSYIPGILSRRVDTLLPDFISERLRGALLHFRKVMPAYYTSAANVIALESRTSAPVRIPRDRKSFEHVQIRGLYPCAEGAGYAGGIVSAAMDGQNTARAIAATMAI